MTEVPNLDDVVASSEALDRPAVGLVAPRGNPDAVAGTVLRASREGVHVFLGYENEQREAVEFARELGATPVELPDSAGDRDVDRARRVLAGRAREAGFPGLVFHGSATDRIDFDRSLDAVHQSTSYVVESVAQSDGDEAILIGIPAYNEEVGIGSVVLAAREFADEVVVADDGSTDMTAELAREAGATVLEHGTNQGKGAAIRNLLAYAEESDCAALVLLDGDGQHLPEDVPTVVDPVLDGDADLVIGSRYMDDRDDGTPLHRRAGQRVLDYLTIGSSKQKVTDSQSGFRALSPAAVERLSLEADNFSVESEMIDVAAREGLDIQEEPIDVRYEGVDGQTQNPLRHGLEVVTFVLQLIRDRHPLLFFGFPGLVLTFVGVGYGLQGFILYQQGGEFYPVKVWVSGFLVLIGALGLFIGLVLNSISNTIARLQDGE